MNAIREMIIKEFLQIRRDKRMLPIMLVAPILQVLILGYAATVDVHHISLVVCDMDRSYESRDLVNRFTNSAYFTVVSYVDDPGGIDRYLDRSEAVLGMVIPSNFGRDAVTGRGTQLQLLADGADANTANISLGYARQIIGGYVRQAGAAAFLRTGSVTSLPRVEAETRVWFNPDLRSANYMVPGVIAMVLMIITATFTSAGLVREKEVGTLEQLLVTPMRPYQLLLGKLLPFVIIGFVDVALVLGVAVVWFDIPLKGSALLLFGLSGLFVMTTLGLGLFVSTVANTQQQAMMSIQFFVFFPFLFLSGFTFPIQNMPPLVQAVTYLIPLRYFLEIIRGLFLKGVGLETLWPEALALVAFGVVILGLSVARFHKRLT